MAGIDTAHLIYLIVLLAMVAGWFFMHSRPNMNKTLQLAAVWGLIFTGAAAGSACGKTSPATAPANISPSAKRVTSSQPAGAMGIIT